MKCVRWFSAWHGGALNISAQLQRPRSSLTVVFRRHVFRVLSHLAVYGKRTWKLEKTVEQGVCADVKDSEGSCGELFSAAQVVRFRQELTEGTWGAFSEVLTEGPVEMTEFP